MADTLKKRRGATATTAIRPRKEDPFAADYKQILADLKEQAKTDLAAKKLWIEIYKSEQEERKHDFVLNIVPYDIEDKSLPRIIGQADVEVVNTCLEALSTRLEADGFSRESKQTLLNLRRLFIDEAERIYAPPQDET